MTRIAGSLAVVVGLAVTILIVVLVRAQDDQRDPVAGSLLGSTSALPTGAGTPELVATADATTLAAHVPIRQSEIDEALRIASEDDTVRAILSDATGAVTVYSVIRLMSSNVRIGAVITYALEKPVDIDLVVPWMDSDAFDDASLKRGYGLAEMRQKVTGLTAFAVKVDLNTKKVAEIVPRRFASVDESVAEIRPIQSGEQALPS